MNAEQLRNDLTEVLADASEPLSTSQAWLAVTERCQRRGRSVVAEEAFRAALVILARRGVVRRADQPGRSAHWELTYHHVGPLRPARGRSGNIESARRTSDLQPPL